MTLLCIVYAARYNWCIASSHRMQWPCHLHSASHHLTAVDNNSSIGLSVWQLSTLNAPSLSFRRNKLPLISLNSLCLSDLPRVRRRSRPTFSTHVENFRRRFDGVVINFFSIPTSNVSTTRRNFQSLLYYVAFFPLQSSCQFFQVRFV